MFSPDDDKEQDRFSRRVTFGLRLLVVCLAVGAVYLLARAIRRGGTEAAAAAAASVVTMGAVATRRGQVRETLDTACLKDQLHEIARAEPLIPPSRLCELLRGCGLPLTSEQQLARELRKLGLRSEVRTVSGRPERRWYDLSAYATHE